MQLVAIVGLLCLNQEGPNSLHILVKQPTYTHDLTIPKFKRQLR